MPGIMRNAGEWSGKFFNILAVCAQSLADAAGHGSAAGEGIIRADRDHSYESNSSTQVSRQINGR